jgi:hypothetical protein
LNKDDTSNILRAVQQTRSSGLADSTIVSVLSYIGDTVQGIYETLLNGTVDDMLRSAAVANNISTTQANNTTNNINANFPNAGNMNEIQNALLNLSNYTSQKLHTNSRLKTTTTPNAYRAK